MRTLTIDEKIEKLRGITTKFLFIEYYTHTNCDMYKISNEHTNYYSDIKVLCPVTDGFETALDLAIEELSKCQEAFWK